MGMTKKYPVEVKERAVRLVLEQQGQHASQWGAIESIAPKFGCAPQTLLDWVRQAEVDGGKRTGLTSNERDRLKCGEARWMVGPAGCSILLAAG